MQDANGPCPLLALANGLLLLGRLRVPDFAAVDAGWLAGELAAYVRARGTTAAAAEQANVAQQVADAVGGVLPALARGVGLDVNPYFASAEAFEYTGALSLMDLCGLRLLHGLVADAAEEPAAAAALRGLSYNGAMDIIVRTLASPVVPAARRPGTPATPGTPAMPPARVPHRSAFDIAESAPPSTTRDAAPSAVEEVATPPWSPTPATEAAVPATPPVGAGAMPPLPPPQPPGAQLTSRPRTGAAGMAGAQHQPHICRAGGHLRLAGGARARRPFSQRALFCHYEAGWPPVAPRD